MKRQRRGRAKLRLKFISISPQMRRKLLLGVGILTAVFIAINIGLYFAYKNRTYPKTQIIDTKIGSTPYSQLAQKVDKLKILPDSIEISKNDQKITVSVDDLGVTKDTQRSVTSANSQRSWLPVVNLFRSPILKAPIKINSDTLNAKAEELAAVFTLAPTNAHLSLDGTTVNITSEMDGYNFDREDLEQTIIKCLDSGKSKITAPVKTVEAQVKSDDLKDDQQNMQEKIATVITFKYESQSVQTTADDIVKWLVAEGEGYTLSESAISTYLSSLGDSFGIRVKNASQVAAAAATAVNQKQPTTITLTAQTASKTYSYCVALKNVGSSYLTAFKSKVQSIYSDSRGWSIGGLIDFNEVASGCDFTVWLSAASSMPSFGTICDADWSCRVGNNVIINVERWDNATTAWNTAGGSLDEYRNMVVNHETGHWLDFRDNNNCPGEGQPALIMQQQSMNLRGCVFNAWPTAGELATLRSRLGI